MRYLIASITLSLSFMACQSSNESKHVNMYPFVGCWQSEDGRGIEEWVQAPNGWLIGYAMNLNANGEMVFFEQMRIERDGAKEVLFVTGGEDVMPIPFTRQPTDNPEVYRFTNPEHDSPQVITYRPEARQLNAQISMLDDSGTHDFPKRACD